MRTITKLAPAKINLTLDILGKRADGYHDLRMVMQTVSLGDRVTVTEIEAGFSLLAEGITEIREIYHIERGYDNLDGKLRALGAKIWRERVQ